MLAINLSMLKCFQSIKLLLTLPCPHCVNLYWARAVNTICILCDCWSMPAMKIHSSHTVPVWLSNYSWGKWKYFLSYILTKYTGYKKGRCLKTSCLNSVRYIAKWLQSSPNILCIEIATGSKHLFAKHLSSIFVLASISTSNVMTFSSLKTASKHSVFNTVLNARTKVVFFWFIFYLCLFRLEHHVTSSHILNISIFFITNVKDNCLSLASNMSWLPKIKMSYLLFHLLD